MILGHPGRRPASSWWMSSCPSILRLRSSAVPDDDRYGCGRSCRLPRLEVEILGRRKATATPEDTPRLKLIAPLRSSAASKGDCHDQPSRGRPSGGDVSILGHPGRRPQLFVPVRSAYRSWRVAIPGRPRRLPPLPGGIHRGFSNDVAILGHADGDRHAPVVVGATGALDVARSSVAPGGDRHGSGTGEGKRRHRVAILGRPEGRPPRRPVRLNRQADDVAILSHRATAKVRTSARHPGRCRHPRSRRRATATMPHPPIV